MIETILFLMINGKYQVVLHGYSGKLYRSDPVQSKKWESFVILDRRRSTRRRSFKIFTASWKLFAI